MLAENTTPGSVYEGKVDPSKIGTSGDEPQPVFNNANVPVFWGTLVGADHIVSATNDIDDCRGPATAWFRCARHRPASDSSRAVPP